MTKSRVTKSEAHRPESGSAPTPAARRTATTPRAARAAGPLGREGARPPTRRRAGPKLPKPVAGTVAAALDKKAEDVVVLDLRRAEGFTDYFVICTGANPRQIAAIADAVRESLARDFAERPALTEGADRSEWILLDYFDFVVHVFSRECRTFYGLERLWGNAVRHEFGEPAGAAS